MSVLKTASLPSDISEYYVKHGDDNIVLKYVIEGILNADSLKVTDVLLNSISSSRKQNNSMLTCYEVSKDEKENNSIDNVRYFVDSLNYIKGDMEKRKNYKTRMSGKFALIVVLQKLATDIKLTTSGIYYKDSYDDEWISSDEMITLVCDEMPELMRCSMSHQQAKEILSGIHLRVSKYLNKKQSKVYDVQTNTSSEPDGSVSIDFGRGRIFTISSDGGKIQEGVSEHVFSSNSRRGLDVSDESSLSEENVRKAVREAFLSLLPVSKDEQSYVWSWLMTTIAYPDQPQSGMYLSAPAASGKTTFGKLMTEILNREPGLVDMSDIGNIKDIAYGQTSLVLDNITGINTSVSNILSSLTTGKSVQEKKLYTNNEVCHKKLKCSFIVTSISVSHLPTDLQSRLVSINIDPKLQTLEYEEWNKKIHNMIPDIRRVLLEDVSEYFTIKKPSKLTPSSRFSGESKIQNYVNAVRDTDLKDYLQNEKDNLFKDAAPTWVEHILDSNPNIQKMKLKDFKNTVIQLCKDKGDIKTMNLLISKTAQQWSSMCETTLFTHPELSGSIYVGQNRAKFIQLCLINEGKEQE